MNKAKILELAERLFIQHPWDKPEKLFSLAKDFIEYADKWKDQLPKLDDLIGPKDSVMIVENVSFRINTSEQGAIEFKDGKAYPLDQLIDDTTS